MRNVVNGGMRRAPPRTTAPRRYGHSYWTGYSSVYNDWARNRETELLEEEIRRRKAEEKEREAEERRREKEENKKNNVEHSRKSGQTCEEYLKWLQIEDDDSIAAYKQFREENREKYPSMIRDVDHCLEEKKKELSRRSPYEGCQEYLLRMGIDIRNKNSYQAFVNKYGKTFPEIIKEIDDCTWSAKYEMNEEEKEKKNDEQTNLAREISRQAGESCTAYLTRLNVIKGFEQYQKWKKDNQDNIHFQNIINDIESCLQEYSRTPKVPKSFFRRAAGEEPPQPPSPPPQAKPAPPPQAKPAAQEKPRELTQEEKRIAAAAEKIAAEKRKKAEEMRSRAEAEAKEAEAKKAEAKKAEAKKAEAKKAEAKEAEAKKAEAKKAEAKKTQKPTSGEYQTTSNSASNSEIKKCMDYLVKEGFIKPDGTFDKKKFIALAKEEGGVQKSQGGHEKYAEVIKCRGIVFGTKGGTRKMKRRTRNTTRRW